MNTSIHSVLAPAPARDPAAGKRLLSVILGIVILWPLLIIAQFDPFAIFDSENLDVFAHFLSQFFPPATSTEFLTLLLTAVIETLAMATAGIALAILLAIPLGLLLTYSLSISRIGPGPGRGVGYVLRMCARFLLLFLRGVPEIVWALLLVRVFGLGTAAGVLAIALTYSGMLGKVYSEILESSDTRACRALLLSGSGRTMAFLYGLLPGAAQELASYTVYRWECAIRASVIMGFVGAGGLGQLMDQSMKMLNASEVSSIVIVFLILVFVADLVSYLIRKGLP
ncbi:MAG: ABC transporter permease [Sheuella sp.]|nr:ABC transporter permease [Sheuella sp.]